MEKFAKSRQTVLKSTTAAFSVFIETSFETKTNQGTMLPTVYVPQSENAVAQLNPSIYLVFSCDAPEFENQNRIYTSYPNIDTLRDALNVVKNNLLNGEAYVGNDLVVRPECADPVVVGGIGKSGNQINFRVCVVNIGDDAISNAVSTNVLGVEVTLVNNGGQQQKVTTSILTPQEFSSLYTIVKDTNLVTLQAVNSFLYLSSKDERKGNNYNPGYNNNYNRNNTGNYYNQYGNTSYSNGGQAQRSFGNNPMPAQPRQTGGFQPVTPARAAQPAAPAQNYQQPQQTNLPPRNSINAAMENTVVEEEINFDDTDAINAIFDNNNGGMPFDE